MLLILFFLFIYLPFAYIAVYGYKYGINIFGDIHENLVLGLQGIIIFASVIFAFFLFKKFYKLKARTKNLITWFLSLSFGLTVFAFSSPFAPLQNYEKTIKSVDVCYFTSEKEIMSLPGTSAEAAIRKFGPPTERLSNGIVFDYLTIVTKEGRHRGVGFYINEDGIITDVMPLTSTTLESNWFRYLPFYSTFASTNLFNFNYLGNDSTAWYELLTGPVILMIFFCFALYFALSAFKFHELLRRSDGKTVASWVEKVVLAIFWIIIYAAMLPFLNVTHSLWLITLPLYIIGIVTALTSSVNGAEDALHMCPSCHKPDTYFPKIHVIKTENQPYHLSGPSYPLRSVSAVMNWIATKDYMEKIRYKKEGKCKNCGYSDPEEYWKEGKKSTQKCPCCGSDLIIKRENISLGTGASRDKYMDNATIDLTRSERKGEDRYRGPVTVDKQTFTSKHTIFDYSEKCPNCSYKFGPKTFTITYEDSNSRIVTEKHTVKLKH